MKSGRILHPRRVRKLKRVYATLLRIHAAKVCWMVLHNYQPDYIDEVVQDAMLDLNGFEARSEFSTWFMGWLSISFVVCFANVFSAKKFRCHRKMSLLTIIYFHGLAKEII